MAHSSKLEARLASYRPVLGRVLFGVALLGVLVAVHLLIQQGRGFDRGCIGFSAPAAVEATFDCNLVTESKAGTLLGISNAYWGIAFYLAVAALSAAAAFVASARLRLNAVRAVLIAGGLGYSAYLTYHQFAGLGALCALCLASAALAATLFVVQALALVRPAPDASPEQKTTSMSASPQRTPRPALFAGLAVALVVLVGADLLYFSSLPEPAEAAAAEASSARTPRASAVADTTDGTLPEGCRFATAQSPLDDPNQLVSFTDPVFGNPDAAVTVAEFFDPNCPHCKTFHPAMKRLIEQYGDRVRFVYKPIPLWRRSVNQIEALFAAAQEDKFEAMLEAQFARQQPQGLSDEQLQQIAGEIGMNPDVLASRLREGTYRQRVAQERQLAAAAGVKATPSVAIDGRLVGRRSRTPSCLTAMIEQEIQQSADGS